MRNAVNSRVYRPGRSGSGGKKRSGGRSGWWALLLVGAILSGILSGLFFDWRYRRVEEEVAELRAENARLSRKIEALKKNPALYEEIARKKYGYVKKNERLIIFEKGR